VILSFLAIVGGFVLLVCFDAIVIIVSYRTSFILEYLFMVWVVSKIRQEMNEQYHIQARHQLYITHAHALCNRSDRLDAIAASRSSVGAVRSVKYLATFTVTRGCANAAPAAQTGNREHFAIIRNDTRVGVYYPTLSNHVEA
jgi:hypothetical protein